MNLALKLARRELRGGVRGLWIVLLCLALGTAVIAAVGTLRSAVETGLAADGTALLGGDLEIDGGAQPLTDALRTWLRDHGATISDIVQMRSLLVAPASGDRQLIELKAVDAAWPLAGSATDDPAQPIAAALAGKDGHYGLLADPIVLGRLNLHPGDLARLGTATFRVAGSLTHEPDRIATAAIFGPRVLISLDALPSTNLISPGSIVRYALRLTAPDPAAILRGIRAAFPGETWRIRGPNDVAPSVDRFIAQTATFLMLVGLTSLLVGGIGVANGVRAWLDARTKTIATLRCLGAPARLIFAVCLIQVLALAAAGIAAGLAAGATLPLIGARLLEPILPVPPVLGVYPVPLLQAAAYGLLTALCFALWPLGRAAQIPGAALFREGLLPSSWSAQADHPCLPHGREVAVSSDTQSTRREDVGGRPAPTMTGWWTRRRATADHDGGLGGPATPLILANIAVAAALVALTVATATDRWFSLWFCIGAVLTLALFRGAAVVAIRLARIIPPVRWPSVRLGIANIHRPGAPTSLLLVSAGLGLSTLAAVALIEGNMRHQIDEQLPARAPSFYFIDIQDAELARFESLVRSQPGFESLDQLPAMRARVVAVNGIPAAKVKTTPETAWALQGDRGLSYSATPPQGSHVIAGHWWPSDYNGPPLVSFAADIAKGWHIGIGDTVTVNVLGRDIDLKIANLRDIHWQSLTLNFVMVASPGLLSHAPHTHIATVRIADADQARLLRVVTDALPNVTGIRVADVLASVGALLGQIAAALTATGALTLVAGTLVVAGAMAAGQRRRVREATILKTLGATSQQIRTAWLTEFGLLGLVAGVTAGAVGSAVSYGVAHYIMHTDWIFLPGTLIWTLAGALAIMLMFGYAGTSAALRARPAPLLRNE